MASKKLFYTEETAKDLPIYSAQITNEILTKQSDGKLGYITVSDLATTISGDSSVDYVVNSVQFGSGESQPKIEATATTLNISNIPTYASNATALAGGLVVGDIYRGADYIAIVH